MSDLFDTALKLANMGATIFVATSAATAGVLFTFRSLGRTIRIDINHSSRQ